MNANRVLLLILVAGLTFLVVIFALRPEMLTDVWMWLIGLAGPVVAIFKKIVLFFKNMFSDKPEETQEVKGPLAPGTPIPFVQETEATPVQEKSAFNGITIQVLRFSDDGETTIGLLYIENQFYCYTIEDTDREEIIRGQTRIPSGEYTVSFNPVNTDYVKTYRAKNDWFDYPIMLNDVPNFAGIYIHNGGTHVDTRGCILVSDSLTVGDRTTTFTNSRETFRKFYEFVSQHLNSGTDVRIVIHDENRIANLN